MLDDCWDIAVSKRFIFVDETTNSKVLISSRVRDVLEGGLVLDIRVPTEQEAMVMMLRAAGINDSNSPPEAALVVTLCKRLPLTIGIAGKLRHVCLSQRHLYCTTVTPTNGMNGIYCYTPGGIYIYLSWLCFEF